MLNRNELRLSIEAFGYYDHGNGWITEGDIDFVTNRLKTKTYYKCKKCGSLLNGPSCYCYDCGYNPEER